MNEEKQFTLLQKVKASESLHRMIAAKTADLPSRRNGFYFPLFIVRWAPLATLGILLFVGIGGGIVARAGIVRPSGYVLPVGQHNILRPLTPIQKGTITQGNVPTPTPTLSVQITPPITAAPTPLPVHEQNWHASLQKYLEHFFRVQRNKKGGE